MGDPMDVSPAVLPEHVAANRTSWDTEAPNMVAAGERSWREQPGEETWGIYGVPESQLHLLPDDLAGLDAIELGCGTGYVSAWMARRGARPVGIDNSPEPARDGAPAPARARDRVPAPPWQRGGGPATPTPRSTWRSASTAPSCGRTRTAGSPRPPACCARRPAPRADQQRPRVPRLPSDADAPLEERLHRTQFGMGRVNWDGGDGVEFHLSHSDWIRLFRANGFEILELLEPQRPGGRDDDLRLGAATTGRAVARRGDLEGPQDRLMQYLRM